MCGRERVQRMRARSVPVNWMPEFAMGSIGLLGFAAIVWALASRVAAWQLLLVASLGWLVISIGLWAAVGRARGGGRHAQENECETTTQVR